MRIDLFLKKVRIVKTRSIAKKMCDDGRVFVNGNKAKAGSKVKSGDKVKIVFPWRELEIKVLEIPQGNVKKEEAVGFYQVESDLTIRSDNPEEERDFWDSLWEEEAIP